MNGGPGTDISYQLFIEVTRPVQCRVGQLGVIRFPAGSYVYTGSARRGLEARLARHARKAKSLRWHIDYLLATPCVRIVWIERSAVSECCLNRSVAGVIVAPRFGASDCTSGCGSHLMYVGMQFQERALVQDQPSTFTAWPAGTR